MEKTSFENTIKLDKTFAAFDIVISDFKRIQKISKYLLAFIMVSYYIYSIFVNVNVLYLLVINSITLGLLALTLLADIVFDCRKRNNKVVKKAIKRSLTYSKHLVKIVATGFALYELVIYNVSVLQTIFTIFTVICVIIQVLIDISVVVIERYIRFIKDGFNKDIEEFNNSFIGKTISVGSKIVDAVKHPKSTFLELIDKPLARITGEQNSDEDSDELKSKKTIKNQDKISVRASEIEQEKKTKKEEQKQENKIKSKSRFDNATKSVKEHLTKIFKNKKTKEM